MSEVISSFSDQLQLLEFVLGYQSKSCCYKDALRERTNWPGRAKEPFQVFAADMGAAVALQELS